MSKGLLKDALPLFDALAKQEPGNPEYLAYKAICLCNQPDKASEAEAIVAKATAASGSHPNILVKQVHNTLHLLNAKITCRLTFFVKLERPI